MGALALAGGAGVQENYTKEGCGGRERGVGDNGRTEMNVCRSLDLQMRALIHHDQPGSSTGAARYT